MKRLIVVLVLAVMLFTSTLFGAHRVLLDLVEGEKYPEPNIRNGK